MVQSLSRAATLLVSSRWSSWSVRVALSAWGFGYGLVGQTSLASGHGAANRPLQDRPRAQEVETVQIGGHRMGRYRFVGALRCRNPSQSLVGVAISQRTVLEGLRIACAEARCDAAGCGWSRLTWGDMAGTHDERAPREATLCPPGHAISGYRASIHLVRVSGAARDYAARFQAQCARIENVVVPSPRGPSSPITLVSQSRRIWIGFRGTPPASAGQPAGEVQDRAVASAKSREGLCRDTAASAISVAVGEYGNGTHRREVVQAVSMFCPRVPRVSSELGN